jgi:hypothetical protein
MKQDLSDKKIIKDEIIERLLGTELFNLIPNVLIENFSKIKAKTKWDFKIISSTTSQVFFIGDIKVRKYSLDKVRELGGVYIEVAKYDFLKKEAEKINATPLFVNFYVDGYATIHNLNKKKIFNKKDETVTIYENVKVQRHFLNDNCKTYILDVNEILEENEENINKLTELHLSNDRTFINMLNAI